MNNSHIKDAARRVIQLIGKYSGGRVGVREMLLDPILFGYLTGRVGSITRQHHVRTVGDRRPKRIDFRIGSSNPVLIEFAVRPPTGGGQLNGSQNRSELLKLCKVPNSVSRRRVLLLIDLYRDPILKNDLKATYDIQHSGKGRFTRHPVRVIYVHRRLEYDFKWSR
jgi:hypothetical protein